MKIVIIDDERKARILLESIILERCKEITQIFDFNRQTTFGQKTHTQIKK